MKILAIIGVVVVGFVALLVFLAVLPPAKPHQLTKQQVADKIEAFLKAEGGAYDWDDFCTFKIADPELDRIRARCAQLDKEFPPGALVGYGYCNDQGRRVLEGYVEYLRRRGA
jgi:hypothetical protein